MIVQWIELLSAFGAGVVIGSLLRNETASSTLPDVKPTSAAELDGMVRELVEGGQYLRAIKLYREFHRRSERRQSRGRRGSRSRTPVTPQPNQRLKVTPLDTLGEMKRSSSARRSLSAIR